MKLVLALILTLGLSFSVFAEGDHADREDITGAGFVMAHVKEVIIGTYNNIPVWADKKCGEYIKGKYKLTAEGESQDFIVHSVDKKLTGFFGAKAIQFAGLDRENQIIKLKDGENMVEIKYTTESFDGEHYHGITWSFNDKTIRLEGEGCLGSMIFYSIFFYGMTTI